MVTVGLIERSGCTEELTLKSNRMSTTEFWVTVIGNGVLETVAVMGLSVGVSSHTELSAHELIVAIEWFTIVNSGFANVSVMLL